jgi:ElaA protein
MAARLTWTLRFFDALTPFEMYRILNLRNEVFVLEQNCLYLDTDEKDLKAWHLMGWNEAGALMAYCRLLPPGVSYTQMSIGRVVTHADARNTGAGKELMQLAQEKCRELFGDAAIKIGAQLYLKGFYESLGFRQVSTVYLEDGIEHIEMVCDPVTAQ